MRRISKLKQSKRGLSPIISVLLLIAIAVVASVVVYAWVMGYIGSSTTKSGDAIQIQSFTSTNGNLTVYVQNTGQGIVDLNPKDSVYVNTVLHGITQSPIGTTAPNPIPIPIGKTISFITDYPYSVFDSITLKVVTTQGVSTSISGKASSASTDNPTGVTITPTTANIAAGSSQTYTAIAVDKNGNSLGVVTATFSVNGVQITGSSVTETKAGIYSITATYKGMSSNSATLNVGPAAAQTVTISPATASIAAGATETYSATATDKYGNSLGDITSSATFYVNNGQISGNSVSETATGTYTVTAVYQSVTSNSASLTVGAGSTITVTISPSTSTIAAGASQAYTATAVDQYGNSLGDVTSQSTFSVNNSPITGSSVSEPTTGTYTVTATYQSAISNTAQLTVTPAAPVSLAISPATATVQAGSTQTFKVTGTDTYGNTWDATSQVTSWQINSAAGGSWSGATYTSQALSGSKPWTVNATIGTVISNNAQLTVTAGGLAGFTVMAPGGVNIGTQTVGTPFQITITAVDSSGNKIATYSGTNTLSLLPSGTITPTSTGAFSAGVWTGSVSASAGTVSISTTGGGKSGTSNSFLVNPASGGSGNVLIFSVGAGQTLTVNQESSVITVERENSQGTAITTGTTTVNLATSSSTGEFLNAQGRQIQSVTIASGSSTASFYYEDWSTGSTLLTATATNYQAATTNFVINPGALSQFQITSASGGNIGTQNQNTPFTIQITALDAYDNQVSWTGTVTLSDVGNSITPTSAQSITSGVGSVSVTITQSYMNGNRDRITATDTANSAVTGQSNSFHVNAPPQLDSFSVTINTANPVAGSPISITVQALDQYGNNYAGFTGTVSLTDTSPGTLSVTSGSFTAGSWTGTVTITKIPNMIYGNIGYDTITATETGNTAITGDSGGFAINSAAASKLVFTTVPSTFTHNVVSGRIQLTLEDQYGNPATSTSSVTVSLSSSYTGTYHFYNSASGGTGNQETQVTITAGSTTSPSFYYMQTAASNGVTFSATASGYTAGSAGPFNVS